MHVHHQSGFTLVELLLSIVIIGLLTGLSLPVYESFVRRNDLDLTAQNLVQTIRRAELYARGANYDNAWGVEVQPTTITLFRGTVFATRNTAFDELISIPASITPSGLGEVEFLKFSATPSTTGTFTLTSTTSDVRTIMINSKGMVNY